MTLATAQQLGYGLMGIDTSIWENQVSIVPNAIKLSDDPVYSLVSLVLICLFRPLSTLRQARVNGSE